MTCQELIQISLEQNRQYLFGLLSDMRDAPTTFPTPKGGNHPLWVLGHVVYAEAAIVTGFILGQENPLAQWEGLFGGGTQPVADASHYPSFDELLAQFERTRAATLELLAATSEADLDSPSRAPEEYKAFFGTKARCFLMLGTHQAFHAGEVADARRAIDRKPLFA